ncbi:hypothetical protein FRB94_000982 [Tulasnella sp. JGI-2019a]|nr:hypothetical protein FRB94_000982 [Tulasnella sp. JGI-2019a]
MLTHLLFISFVFLTPSLWAYPRRSNIQAKRIVSEDEGYVQVQRDHPYFDTGSHPVQHGNSAMHIEDLVQQSADASERDHPTVASHHSGDINGYLVPSSQEVIRLHALLRNGFSTASKIEGLDVAMRGVDMPQNHEVATEAASERVPSTNKRPVIPVEPSIGGNLLTFPTVEKQMATEAGVTLGAIKGFGDVGRVKGWGMIPHGEQREKLKVEVAKLWDERELHRPPTTQKKIAENLGITLGLLQKLLQETGCPQKRPRLTDEQRDSLQNDILEEWNRRVSDGGSRPTLQQMATKFGTSTPFVSEALAEKGARKPKRQRHISERVKKICEEWSSSPQEPVRVAFAKRHHIHIKTLRRILVDCE